MRDGKHEVGAAVLAGGTSSRMGSDKALVRLREGGPTVVEMVIGALRKAGFQKPLLVVNKMEQYAFLGLECVRDDVEGAGTLGGILTALNHSEHGKVLIVACDMPLLNPGLIKYMAAIEDGYDALVPRWTDGEEVRVEPLHAIYAARCAERIGAEIDDGRLKVANFLRGANVRYVEEKELRAYDRNLNSFSNVNTPEEWTRVREVLSQEGQ